MVEEAEVAFPHGAHVFARERVADASPGLGLGAGGEVVDGEGDVGAVFVAGEGLGFEEPVDFLGAVGGAVGGGGGLESGCCGV